jgi:hypothetical protein
MNFEPRIKTGRVVVGYFGYYGSRLIGPGQSKQLALMRRLAPDFIKGAALEGF